MNTPKIENAVEYKLRVPRKLVKDYYVMKLNSPRPVNFGEISDAYISRHAPTGGDEDSSAGQSAGAGSEFGKEWKEEMKRRRRGRVKKEVTKEDMLYSVKLCGKKNKSFKGKREGTILENSAYYILTQSPDGVFEAVPIQAWYSLNPTISYSTLSHEDVEKEFAKRDRTLNYHNLMLQKRIKDAGEPDDTSILGDKVKSMYRDDLVIHDDDIDDDYDVRSEKSADSGDTTTDSKQKKGKEGKKKDKYISKKKKNTEEQDSDEEEEFDNLESKECDYMSESSTDDEAALLEDEPEPETNRRTKAKDDLNAFTLSDSEEEEETEEGLTSAGKELKEILKREEGNDESSSDEDEDIDDDEKYSKSALFMQGNDGKKKKPGASGSVSGSSSSSRSATPTMQGEAAQGTSKSASKSKDAKSKKDVSNRSTPTQHGSKKKSDSLSRKRTGGKDVLDDSPPSKREKMQHKSLAANMSGKKGKKPGEGESMAASDSSKEPLAITESTIRRYLAHKPMTTTDLVRKFKTKKTGLTKEQTVSTIAAILKRIGPEKQHIDGKLYLSIKPGKK